MKLITELQERWKAIFLERESVEKRADELAEDMQELEVALVALQGLHAPIADEPQEIEASSQSESCVPELGAETDLQTSPGEAEESRDQFEEEAERAAAIELTADVMPESGLHEEAPALNADMQDEREQPVTDVAALIASGEHSYDEVAAIAYPEPAQIAQGSIADVAQPEWNGPTLPGGYAPVTSPEADEAAKAHEYYDPKAVAERDRNAGMARLFSYNPFYKPKVDA